MKLGSQTGSLVNHVLSRATIGQPDPVVGMGATLLAWTDRHACTIISVGPNVIMVREDHARVTSGDIFKGCTYEYEPNPQGPCYCFQMRDGQWVEVMRSAKNRWKKSGDYGLRIGEREEYRDPSF